MRAALVQNLSIIIGVGSREQMRLKIENRKLLQFFSAQFRFPVQFSVKALIYVHWL